MTPFPPWLEALLPAHRRAMILAGGRNFHVMEFGPKDGFPVLMIHGNPTWGFLYRKVAARLLGRPIRVIAPDLQGLGFSDQPRFSEHTLENHAAWMADLINALGLERYMIVVQDWGGAIGVLGASLANHPPQGMVVLNTGLSPPRPGFRPTLFHRFARLPGVSDFAFRVVGFPQVRLGIVQGDPSSISGQVSRAYRFPLRGLRRNAAPLALARMVPDGLDHPSVRPLTECHAYFEAFKGPVEFVWGSNDPILGSVIRWLKKVKPDARCEITPGGHFLQEEVPDEIAEAVLRVLESIGEALEHGEADRA